VTLPGGELAVKDLSLCRRSIYNTADFLIRKQICMWAINASPDEGTGGFAISAGLLSVI
jgi:hypothetical protein